MSGTITEAQRTELAAMNNQGRVAEVWQKLTEFGDTYAASALTTSQFR